jgi:hypothetical protein
MRGLTQYEQIMAVAFADELMKIKSAEAASGKLSPTTLKTVGLLGAGALGYHTVSQANNDRKMGRQMRLQQGY